MNEQSQHIGYIINQLMAGNQKVVEASEEAEEEWVQTIISLARSNEKFQADCTPGYYNNEGQPEGRSLQNANYGKGSPAFFKVLDEWRKEGLMKGLEVR